MAGHLYDLVDNVKAIVTDLPAWAQVGLAGIAATVPVIVYRHYNSERKSPFKEDWEPDVVYVYQWPRCATVPSVSPFCIKLETWLRMADIKYQNAATPLWLRSKEGMLPFIELNGVEYPDSGLIMDKLMSLKNLGQMEAHLSKEQRGAARAFEKMTENSTLPSYSNVRYGEKAGEVFTEKTIGKRFMAQIPFIYHLLFHPALIRRNIKKNLVAHGIGKHSDEDIQGIGLADLDALSAYLGDKPFFTGAKALRVDATVFGLLSQLLYVQIDTPHGQHVKENLPNLVAFAERVKEKFWPDWDEVLETGKMDTNWKSAAVPTKDAKYKSPVSTQSPLKK